MSAPNPKAHPAQVGVLTARQIKAFDEIRIDQSTAESALKVALTFYANRMNELSKQSEELWRELAELHGLDLNRHVYATRVVDGVGCIVIKRERP